MPGYAIVDLETTGFDYSRRDRILEIAIIQLTEGHEIEDEWTTLINPLRDVGPQHIHGITAGEVRRAPTFKVLWPQVAQKLDGRIIVAHNLGFEASFLNNEFARVDARVADIDDNLGICTRRLAREVGDRSLNNLMACCRRFGIVVEGRHSALQDARYASHLYLRLREDVSVQLELQNCRPWHADVPMHPTPMVSVLRAESENSKAVSWVATLGDQNPPNADDIFTTYRRELERIVCTAGVFPESTRQSLETIARRLGISSSNATECHQQLLESLDRSLRAAGCPAHEIPALIYQTAQSLGLTGKPEANGPPQTSSDMFGAMLSVGDTYAVTGCPAATVRAWQARASSVGLTFNVSGVTKTTSLLVAADPESLSGKAQKARSYGVRILGARDFEVALSSLEESSRARSPDASE